MFLSVNQQRTLQRIVNDKARCDNARLQHVLNSMLPCDIVRDGKFTISLESITIKANGKTQKITLKTDKN